jgi:hypothetical protein
VLAGLGVLYAGNVLDFLSTPKEVAAQQSSLVARAIGSVEATLPQAIRGNALRGFDGSGPRSLRQS